MTLVEFEGGEARYFLVAGPVNLAEITMALGRPVELLSIWSGRSVVLLRVRGVEAAHPRPKVPYIGSRKAVAPLTA